MPPRARFFPLILGLLSATLFVRLGIWQLDRLHERRARNAVAETARKASPVNLNDERIRRDSSIADRAVVVRGEYDRSHEIVLRNHVYRDAPGIWLVTPLRIAGSDSAILVTRGFVPAPDAITADVATLNEAGEVTVRGPAVSIPVTTDSGDPVERLGQVSWKRLDLVALRQRLPYPILGISILQAPDSALPLRPIRLEPLALDDGPHLSYAVQWFSFAVIAVVGGALLSRRGSGSGAVVPTLKSG